MANEKTDRVKIDIDELHEIMDDLDAPDNEKRKNSLTKDDILVIAKVVQAVSHNTCAMGFTPDEINMVKRIVGTLNKGILVVGYAVLGAIGAGIVSITVWAVKHGIIEVAQNGSKVVGK